MSVGGLERKDPARLAGGQKEADERERSYNILMADEAAHVLATRLRTALDLCEMGEAMRRAQLRREYMDATDEEIEALVVMWLQTRPGAEHGDGWGRPISWPPARV